MDYLTQYYKNRAKQLQEELNYLNSLKILNERQSLGNPTFGRVGRNIVPAGSAGPKPGRRPPTMLPKQDDGRSTFTRPVVPPNPGEDLPQFPPGLDPGTNNPMYPSQDHGGQPFGPGQYPYYYDENGNPTYYPVNPNSFPWLNTQ